MIMPKGQQLLLPVNPVFIVASLVLALEAPNGEVLLFEFKVVELTPQGKALAQIKDKGYADKYRDRGEPIHLVGVEFSKNDRNIVGFEVETA